MSKGLEALKEKYLKLLYGTNTPISMEETLLFDNIEKELERLEELEEEKKSFDRAIEKKLKALDIIKNTFDMKLVVPVPKGGYELQIMNKGSFVIYTYANISKEDYDLLKEVLL